MTGVTVPLTAVHLVAPDKVVVKMAITLTAVLSVDASGNLVATAAGIPPVTLLRAGEDVPMKFTSVKVDAAGNLVLAGTLSVGLLGG